MKNTMNTITEKRQIEKAITGFSEYELRKEIDRDGIYLTENQFQSYAQNRINGCSESQAYSYILEDIDYDFIEENEKAEEYQTAINNFFCNGQVMGVQSVEEALMVFEWIQARYSAVNNDVKSKYDSDKESLTRYIIKNQK